MSAASSPSGHTRRSAQSSRPRQPAPRRSPSVTFSTRIPGRASSSSTTSTRIEVLPCAQGLPTTATTRGRSGSGTLQGDLNLVAHAQKGRGDSVRVRVEAGGGHRHRDRSDAAVDVRDAHPGPADADVMFFAIVAEAGAADLFELAQQIIARDQLALRLSLIHISEPTRLG